MKQLKHLEYFCSFCGSPTWIDVLQITSGFFPDYDNEWCIVCGHRRQNHWYLPGYGLLANYKIRFVSDAFVWQDVTAYWMKQLVSPMASSAQRRGEIARKE